MNKEYDVIVVGGGNAALCAALSAREHGANVLVLERAPQASRGGNSAFSGGGLRMVHHGLEDIKSFAPELTSEQIARSDFGAYTAAQYLDDLGSMTEYRIDPDLAELFVNQSTDTVRWMRGHGVRFAPQYEWNSYQQGDRFVFPTGFVIAIVGGGRSLMDAEYEAAARLGITIRYRARTLRLLHGASGIEGVCVATNRVEKEIRARSIILACGGFESNREWRARYLGPGWDLAKVRGTRYNMGDGLRMALDAGAQPHGQWSGAHACAWDLNAPDYGDLAIGSAYSKHNYPWGIMLNADGRRFLDEGADIFTNTYAKYGRIIMEQPGQFAWQIFDSKTLPLLHGAYRIKQVTKVTAETLDELVAKLDGVNRTRAMATLTEFNAAVRSDIPFKPKTRDGRSTTGLAIPKSNWANAIDTPPFVAYAVTSGITMTFGGLKITTRAEVVDTEEQSIPGLYAAGELVGGIFYFNYPGGAGLMSGAVFGRIAGEQAARHALGK